jgi:hypothetical protein
MSKYPNGFFKLIGLTGTEYLCYHCDRCDTTIHDIPQKGIVNYRGEKVETLWCCGKQVKIGKPHDTVRAEQVQARGVYFI